MMKTVTTTHSEIVSAFTASMADYILQIDHLEEMEDATETFLKDLRNLLVVKRGMAATTLRRLFSEGFTCMMLPHNAFEQLEVADAEGDDFCLVIENEGETLCILCKAELTW